MEDGRQCPPLVRKMGYDTSTDDKISKFNAGLLKMQRMDKIFSLLHDISSNLLAFNQDYGIYNFELKLRMCNQLYQEVESKLKDSERVKAQALGKAIELGLEKYPVYETQSDVINGKKMHVNHEVWKVVRDWLFNYESLVRQFIDKYGMDTAYEDDEGLF
jgi:hypothetical protein